MGDLDFALSFVNKGLANVPPKERPDLLLKAFSLRAEILLRARHFAPSARDATRALALNSDADLRARLKTILDLSVRFSADPEEDAKMQETEAGDSEGAVSEIQKAVEEKDRQIGILKVEVPNALVPCASDAVVLKVQDSGRMRFVAVRDIKPGEVVMVEEPLVSNLHSDQSNRCCFCLQTSFDLLPCDTCCWVGFLPFG